MADCSSGQVRILAGTIESILPRSTAEDMGLRPGDTVVAVNGQKLRDVIDFRFEIAGESVEVEAVTRDGPVVLEIEKEYDDNLGVSFTQEVFDGVKPCANACPFCFVRNLPGNMRASLYQRDDDYRLSFLHGNFVTLTNVTSAEMERIASQGLSPLYVSVHSTDPAIRARMLGLRSEARQKAADIMGVLAPLAEAGVRFHCQVVLVPGINDGEDLEKTLTDLAGLRPKVLSVGMVPVGLTRFCAAGGMRTLEPAEASSVLDRLERWSEGTRNRGLVFASDELFLLAGRQIPDAEYYRDYPQYENGIGMVRVFIDGCRDLPPAPEALPFGREITIVTGEAFAPFMRTFAGRYAAVRGLRVSVASVRNRFFGGQVTVAGLMVGKDVASSLASGMGSGTAAQPSARTVLLPASCLNDGRFLDDMTTTKLAQSCGAQVIALPPDPEALDHFITGTNGGHRGT